MSQIKPEDLNDAFDLKHGFNNVSLSVSNSNIVPPFLAIRRKESKQELREGNKYD